mmetsp:Transcript_19810/g.43293  ORF Transcript_19810/g.43293 Transcript_19810/m.43293 type:complete len:295 (-) Transcript_19810:308-1192(-)
MQQSMVQGLIAHVCKLALPDLALHPRGRHCASNRLPDGCNETKVDLALVKKLDRIHQCINVAFCAVRRCQVKGGLPHTGDLTAEAIIEVLLEARRRSLCRALAHILKALQLRFALEAQKVLLVRGDFVGQGQAHQVVLLLGAIVDSIRMEGQHVRHHGGAALLVSQAHKHNRFLPLIDAAQGCAHVRREHLGTAGLRHGHISHFCLNGLVCHFCLHGLVSHWCLRLSRSVAFSVVIGCVIAGNCRFVPGLNGNGWLGSGFVADDAPLEGPSRSACLLTQNGDRGGLVCAVRDHV